MSAPCASRLACCRYALSECCCPLPWQLDTGTPSTLRNNGCSVWHGQRGWCWWGSFWLCQTQLCHNFLMCLSYLFSVWLLCVKSHEQFPGCCLIWLMAISHINAIRWGSMASSPHGINSGQMPLGQGCAFVAHTFCICSHLCPNVCCFPGQCWACLKVPRQQAQGTIQTQGTVQKEMCRDKAVTRAAESNTPLKTKLLTSSEPSWGSQNKMHSTVGHCSSALGVHLLSIAKPR